MFNGDPACIKVCPAGAITFEEVSMESRLKLIANADKLPGVVSQALGAA
jgi:ferredoxin